MSEIPIARGTHDLFENFDSMGDPRAEVLLAAAIQAATFVLKKETGFIPFGMELPAKAASKPTIVLYDEGGEHISDRYAGTISKLLHKDLADGKVTATILTIEVTTRKREGGPERDAMLCRIERDGAEAVVLAVPFTRSASGKVTLGEIQRVPPSQFPKIE